ncbi:unnamed protein product, partial [Closterium sp. NIES-53]
MVGLVEPTVSLAPEAGEDFQAVVAAVQANPMAVLLDSGCSHHLMGSKAVFVDMAPSGSVKHVRGFNGALQPVEGRGTIALQGEAGMRVLIPDVLYIPGVQANLLSAGQLKESGVQLKGDGDEMLLDAATGKVLGRARYTGRVLCTDLRPCPMQSQPTEVVALRTIVPATKSTPDRLHARLAHVSFDTIKSSAKHDVATGLDINPSTGADPPCVSCVGGKLARHTFPAKGLDAAEVLAVVHIDLCGPFRVSAKDGSVHFLLLKDRHTRFVWVMPIAKKSDVLREFQRWLVLVERQMKKSVLMLRSDRGGEFLAKEFTDFVDSKGIVHDQMCPYTPQQNGMAEREMRTAVESVRTMLLHMCVQHHWWHLALRQAVWVRNCLERSTTPPGTTLYQLLTGKKPDLTLVRVWGCMVQFMVPEQQRGGKLALKARWGLHLGVSPESKGWEILDLTDNKVVMSVEVIFYETLSLEVWKAKFGTASGRTQAHTPTDTLMVTVPLLVEVDEPVDEDVVEVLPPPPVLAPPLPVADWPASTPVSTTGDEGSLEAVAPASGIAGGRQGAKPVDQDKNPSTTGEQQTGEPVEQETSAGVHSTGELLNSAGGEQLIEGSKQLVDDLNVDEEGELSAGEESTDSDVVEVPITKPELRRTGRARRPPERLSFHACLLPVAFTTERDEVDDDLLYDDAKEDEELPELDPDVHADPEHRWGITTMTVKEALASWKGKAVKAAMEEEICSLVGMGTWELVERPRGVHIMRNRWVLTTKYRLDDTVEREKARLVVKGFTQVCGADYDKTYSPVRSYVTLRIFFSIVAVLDLNLTQLDMKNAFLQSKLDRVLYMYQPDYFDDGTSRGTRWSGAGSWLEEEQVNEALYFKVGDDGVTCWVLVYVDDLLAASSSPAMLKELKELLKATSGWYPEVDVARHAQAKANECATVQVRPIICVHLRACALLSSTGQRWTAALLHPWHTVDLLCWQPASPLPGPSPHSGPTRGLAERLKPESRPVSPESRSASPVCTFRAGRRVSRPRYPSNPGTHSMTLRPSTAPQRVPLPSPPASSLLALVDPESDSLRASSPTVTRFVATAVTDPLFESTAASALVAELVEFAAAYRLDYATSLVVESGSASICPSSVGGECALGTDVLEDKQEEFECFAASVPHLVSMLLAPEGDPDAPDIPTPRSYAEAIEGPYSSQWQAAMDAEMASWKSTGTYVDEVPPPGANIVSGMWIFRVKRPPGSPPVFKARYVAHGFSQRQGVDFFQNFSPTPKMTTLR